MLRADLLGGGNAAPACSPRACWLAVLQQACEDDHGLAPQRDGLYRLHVDCLLSLQSGLHQPQRCSCLRLKSRASLWPAPMVPQQTASLPYAFQSLSQVSQLPPWRVPLHGQLHVAAWKTQTTSRGALRLGLKPCAVAKALRTCCARSRFEAEGGQENDRLQCCFAAPARIVVRDHQQTGQHSASLLRVARILRLCFLGALQAILLRMRHCCYTSLGSAQSVCHHLRCLLLQKERHRPRVLVYEFNLSNLRGERVESR